MNTLTIMPKHKIESGYIVKIIYSWLLLVTWNPITLYEQMIIDKKQFKKKKKVLSYLPIPPLGQDMTQGQFLSGVLNSEFSF